MSQYWEAYLLQQIGQTVNSLQLETGNTPEAASRRHNMQESIVMIFMTIILEMIQTRFETKVAKQIIQTYLEKLKLSDQSKSKVLVFLD